jgi:hypothetical protein
MLMIHYDHEKKPPGIFLVTRVTVSPRSGHEKRAGVKKSAGRQ